MTVTTLSAYKFPTTLFRTEEAFQMRGETSSRAKKKKKSSFPYSSSYGYRDLDEIKYDE